jgi:hypothetical protein
MLSYPCGYGSHIRALHDDIFLCWLARPGRRE